MNPLLYYTFKGRRFLLSNAYCMEKWRERYEMLWTNMTLRPFFTKWILPAVQSDIANGRHVSHMKLDIAVGPGDKAEFYNMCWAFGRHFECCRETY